jgi:opacity protein-like surface antigen
MRPFICVVVLVMCNLAVFAQDAPKAEIFAGFSYGNFELIPGTSSFSSPTETVSSSSSGRLGTFGWDGSVAVNMNRWFSFATDFSGYYSGSSTSTTRTVTLPTGTETITNVASNPKIHNFLFGPQFSYPAGKIRPFAHFLLGGQHADVTRSEIITCATCFIIGIPINVGSGIEFAMALGGGVDYSFKHNLAWRLESDYLTNQGTGQNHVRVSTGLVWQLGK